METLHHVAPLLPSVGRINGRGSCILLSMTPDTAGDPSKCRAVLLTTSHCLTRRVDAHGLEAIFFENPLEGSSTHSSSSSSTSASSSQLSGGAGRYSRRGAPQQPVVVLLRPEQVFITSAEDPKAKKSQQQQQFLQNSQFLNNSNGANKTQTAGSNQQQHKSIHQNTTSQNQESSVGYTIVACDVEGRFLEKFQQQQQDLQNESNRRRMSAMMQTGALNETGAQQRNADNKNKNLASGLNMNLNSDYGLDPLGTPDAFQSRTASKYRPLFDKKAIERAAQARLEEVTRKQQDEIAQQQEAHFCRSELQKSAAAATSSTQLQLQQQQQRHSSTSFSNESWTFGDRPHQQQHHQPQPEEEEEEGEYYYDEVLKTVVKKQKKRQILASTASFHRTQSTGMLVKAPSLVASGNAGGHDYYNHQLSSQQQQQQQQPQSSSSNRVSNASLTAASNHQILNQAPPTISSIIPIGLPLLQSRSPHVNKGDTHLVVTHADGGPNRKIYSLSVSETHEGYCVYNEVDATIMFASGGLVFATTGEFIGIQHQSPGPASSHYCMFIREITQHLFLTHSLSSIQIPILDGNVEDVDGIVGTVAKSVLDRDLFVLGEDPLWKRQRDALIRGNQIDPDLLNSSAPSAGILTGDARAMHVRTKSRYGGNYSQLVEFSELERERNLRNRYIPKTLLVCDHLEIFDAYYKQDDYSSLVHMVGSFGYHPALTKLMLSKLVSHEHRNDLQKFAEYQGMPPLLEVMERNGENADITQAGVTALGRLTQFELNREALNRYNGLQTLLAILQGWPHHVQIIEWGCFCLMNMTAPSTLRAKENIKTISDNDGVSLLCGFVKNLGIHGKSSAHICRWGLISLSNLIGDDKSAFDRAIAQNNDLCSIIVDGIVQFSTSSYALHGVSECFLTLVHLELYDAAIDFFINAGALSRVLSILQALSSAWTLKSSASFISSSIVATINAHSHTSTYEFNQNNHANNNMNNNNNRNFGGASSTNQQHEDNNNNDSAVFLPASSSNKTATSIGSSISSSFGSAADAVVAQNFLTALHHVVQQRPYVKADLVYLGAVEIASACARVFAKEGELVNVVASLMSSLSY